MKKIMSFILLSALFINSCKFDKQQIITFPQKNQIFGLATPVKLNMDSTQIYLEDYFTDASLIDSISADKNLSLSLSNDKKILKVKILSDSLPKLSVLNVFIDGFKYSLLLRKSDKLLYEYVFDPHGKQYKKVALKGEFNAWNPENTPLKFDKGVWTAKITAEPGEYQYLIVLDGKEQIDPANPDSISNNMGGFNSVLKIGKLKDEKKPHLQTSSFSDRYISLKYSNKVDKFFVFIDNFLLPQHYLTQNGDSLKILIPFNTTKIEKSYIRVFAYNKNGVSNDIKIPLKYGKVIDKASELTRTDYEATVIYNVFVDRFYNGNPNNDKPLNTPEVLPKVDYHGGDIAGITKKLKQGYFDSLGVNTLWISPIVKNVNGAYGHWPKPETKFSAYHGYWPVSFTEIDERFGTPNEFTTLVNSLHQKNYNIIVDFVAHHVHKEAKFYKEHPQWVTNLYLPDGSLNTERWDDHRLTTWFDVFLPTLDNSKPEVANIVTDSALWWVQKYNIDGFRHDAAKHVPLSFWRLLTYKLKREIEIPQNKKLYQIGETYGTPELISSYINSGMLDAQFDFNVYDAISTALAAGNSFINVKKSLLTSFKYYGWHNLMGYITGNQDRGRFISYAGGDLHFDEDAKMAGWTRNIGVGNAVAYKKSAMLFAFITTIPGIPVIYYGDEIGMPGGNDPDNRRDMIFNNLNNQQKQLKTTVSRLVHFRRNSMPLIFGDFKFLTVSDKIMVYQRTYFNKITIVLFNNSSDNQMITFECKYQNLKSFNNTEFTQKKGKITIEIPANSFEILFN